VSFGARFAFFTGDDCWGDVVIFIFGEDFFWGFFRIELWWSRRIESWWIIFES
jgi:hypothetical protein